MKLSTKTRYGLRALIELASSGDQQIPLAKIASNQNLSANYMEQVFVTLRKANIIKSVKGAQGGYSLAKSSDQITVADIIRVLEGEILIVEGDDDKANESLIAHNMRKCLQEKVWIPINQSIKLVIDNITLADLVEDFRRVNDNGSDMYYI